MRPPRTSRRAAAALLAVLALALAGFGCGGSESTSAETDAESAGVGALVHADGVLVARDDAYQLTPATGGAPITFTLGPEVQGVEVRALAAAGAPARVTYRPSEDVPVAVAVAPAPRLGEGLQAYTGQLTSVTEDELVVDGPDGERRFTIADADRPAFDLTHLRDHESEQSPVRIYFDPKQPGAGVAYEDA